MDTIRQLKQVLLHIPCVLTTKTKEANTRSYSWNTYSYKFHKIHRKTPPLVFVKSIEKETSAQMFSCEFYKTFKNLFSKEHLVITVSFSSSLKPWSLFSWLPKGGQIIYAQTEGQGGYFQASFCFSKKSLCEVKASGQHLSFSIVRYSSTWTHNKNKLHQSSSTVDSDVFSISIF